MKKVLTIIFLIFTINVFAQKKQERFCKFYVTTYSNREKRGDIIKIDIGTDGLLLNLNDSFEIKSLRNINDFKSDIDALNFMEKMGWKLVTIICYRPTNTIVNEESRKEFYFKKDY